VEYYQSSHLCNKNIRLYEPQTIMADYFSNGAITLINWYTATRCGTKGYNQDAVWHTADGHLCVIADGAGGVSRNSDRASGASVSVSARLYSAEGRPQLLDEIVQAINAELRTRMLQGEDVGATTFAAVHMVAPKQAVVTSLGDSCIYLVRAGEVVLNVRPRYRYDHIITHGFVTQADADAIYQGLPWWLQQQLGSWLPSLRINPTLYPVATQPGDLWVLCTDGISDVFSPAEIATALWDHTPESALTKLLADAFSLGSHDDLTCAIGYL
jgi:serine/threonine protein phosphatase PrpC